MPNLQIRVGLDEGHHYVARCKLLPGGCVSAGSVSALRWKCSGALNGRSVDLVLSMEARLWHARQQVFLQARRARRPVQPAA